MLATIWRFQGNSSTFLSTKYSTHSNKVCVPLDWTGFWWKVFQESHGSTQEENYGNVSGTDYQANEISPPPSPQMGQVIIWCSYKFVAASEKFFSDRESGFPPVPSSASFSYKLRYVASVISPPFLVSYWLQVYWGIKAARDLREERPPRHASSDGLADAVLSKHKEVGMDERWVKASKGEQAANCNFLFFFCSSLQKV